MAAERLAGKRILVTGSGRGIGQAIAVLCSQEGAKVALSSRTKTELEETASKMSNECLVLPADLTRQEDVDDLVDSIVSSWGGLDILINNAGGPQTTKAPCEDLSSDDLSRILELNVVSVHRVSKAVINRAMKPSGQIVNISSRAGKKGLPTMGFYVASKFALEGLTATMAVELKDRNIRVNTLSPGMVNTNSFPKPQDRKGVRTAESIRDGLFVLLESEATGCYLHVDELDLARERGLPDSIAIKPINEPLFDPIEDAACAAPKE
jgi:NAD(P)-dependent dehydrogenase (short-subunit alcohol dehydrogenase family)